MKADVNKRMSGVLRRGAVVALAAITAATATTLATDAGADQSTEAPATTGISLSMSVDPGDPVPVALITEDAAEELYDNGVYGQGVDIALIDSGIAPVPGLDQPGKILYGPDLSNEGGQPNLANLDTYGHGTHLAGIMVGDDGKGVAGVAPRSRLVSVKVAGATGETDIAQVIAGIDWVIEHKDDPGLNIRVLNLSLGVAGLKTNEGDPLSAAVERAWDAGIVVVAAAGNRGNDAPGIDSPALSPYVLAVGGTESYESSGEKDTVASWSSGGNEYRASDVVAPGRSILSFRVPGSMLDQLHPQAVVGERYFRGSGTSQSAAVVSGFTALLLSADPSMTPDQVKFLYQMFADDIAEGTRLDGYGRLDLERTWEQARYKLKAPVQSHQRAIPQTCTTFSSDLQVVRWEPTISTTEPIDAALVKVSESNEFDDEFNDDEEFDVEDPFVLGSADDEVKGEPFDVLGNDEVLLEEQPVDENADSKNVEEYAATPIQTDGVTVPCGDAWSGGSWNGATWSGGVWNGATWSGATWSGATWSGGVWSGATWSGATWSGATWSGATWSGATWSGATWSGATWSGATWSSTSPSEWGVS